MDKRFLRACTDPSETVIMGYRLKPWCLKYRLWLTAFGSPFISGKDVTPADLLLALKLCSETRVGKATWLDRWHIIGMHMRRNAYNRDLRRFMSYTCVENWPKFWDKKTSKASNAKGVPWVLQVVTSLIANGIDEKRAWEMPECQAIWYNTAFGIAKGADVNILTTEEEEHLEELEKLGMPAKTVAKPSEAKE